ncbi:MAG: ribosome biogenesis GTPase Der [Proteobacteria bacterium]|nr:ribosome biogenesis GTPase Der [Pseudomonadota bacterium]MBI3497844.1 ribosome biogenesis GTPase Der [Pseudomonadota bacterium]
MAYTVAIVGRPNVGKSTLFNRLVGRRQALVDDTPGVTRDRREAEARLGQLRFRLIDTAGLEEAFDKTLASRMREQSERAVAEADVALFLIDARAGVTPLDAALARRLRRSKTPILLVANKCEGAAAESGLGEAFALGLGQPLAISAEHGQGLDALHDKLRAMAPAGADAADAAEEGEAKPIMLAIVGRPNVGKSTLVNRLIGDERVLTGPEPGITRDAVAIDWEHRGRPVRLVDTAGLRRRARIDQRLEQLSVGDTLRTVRFAEVVILVLDAEKILDKQDLAIARHVLEEGRALVVAVNKWDAVGDRKAALQRLKERLEDSLPQARGIAALTISALKGTNLDKLMDAVFAAHASWNRRLPTAQLNRWLYEATERHQPPLVSGRRLKLRYMTQVKSRPPTFALWVSKIDELPESYEKYLIGSLRKTFGMPGVPIRLLLRKGKNPYVDQKDK